MMGKYIVKIVPVDGVEKPLTFKFKLSLLVSFIVIFLLGFITSIVFAINAKRKLAEYARYKTLAQENAYLRLKLSKLEDKARELEALIDSLFKKELSWRTITGMKFPPVEIREMGVGGTIEEEPPEPDLKPVLELENKIDRLLKLALYEKNSFDDITKKLEKDITRREHTPSIIPVNGLFTSGFGKRIDPFTGRLSFHPGIDLAAPIGTPVYAPAAGRVRKITWLKGYGLTLEIDHGYGVVTRYAHLARVSVKLGQRVKRGDIIAYVGNTGRSTGPHLHYEVIVYGKHVNPWRYIIPPTAYYD